MLGIETNMYSTHVYTNFGVDLKVYMHAGWKIMAINI